MFETKIFEIELLKAQLTALRCGLQEILERLEEIEEAWKISGRALTETAEKKEWDPEKIKWVNVYGLKGPYQWYPAEGQKVESTEDWKALRSDLKSQGASW